MRLYVKLPFPDLQEFFEKLNAKDKSRFAEQAILHFALGVGQSWVEQVLGRPALKKGKRKSAQPPKKTDKKATTPIKTTPKATPVKTTAKKSEHSSSHAPASVWNMIGMPERNN